MDVVDRAAKAQAINDAAALEARKPPASVLRRNVECKDCGETNDRPEYAICTECLQIHHPGIAL